jgi:hypothetical protein
MTEFKVDKRDIQFLLYEQLGMMQLTEFERYEGMTREDFDMVLSEAIKFFGEELAPTFREADETGCKLVDGQVYVPESYIELYKKYGRNGWIAVSQNPDFGGMGLPMAMAIALSEFAISAAPSFMFYPGLTASAAHLIENFANEKMRNLLVPKMYGGEWTGTMCLTEPQAGSFLADISTTAVPIPGTDEFSIKGSKIFISAGDHQLTDNIIHLVLARVPGDPATTKGISLFAVPKRRYDPESGEVLGSNDVTTTAIEHKMGINASSTCSLSFGDQGECRGYLVGEQCKGIVYMFQMMNEARIVCGVQGAALGSAAYERALSYAKERSQGTDLTRPGDETRVAIIDHPDVRRNLLYSKAYVEGIRALLLQTSIFSDLAHNHPDPKEREKNNDLLELLTPICKSYATDKGFKVTELAIQIHGGYGYIKEYGVEQCMRDLKIASLYEGTNGIQALDLLGRKMRMKGGGVFLTWLQEANAFLQSHKEHPTLSPLVAQVEKAKNVLAETAFGFSMNGAKDPRHTLLSATPFLEIFGHVEVGRLLLHQAIIATDKLNDIISAKGVSEEAVAELIKEHSEARFYDGKIKTATFFVYNILPSVRALANGIKSGDRSALDITF